MFKKTILPNGLRLVTIPVEGTKTATVLVLVNTGSRFEDRKINGVSHFLEHMFFKGTKKRSNTKAISEELDRVGGEFNAFTHKEYTGYYAKVGSPHLDMALDVISDIFLNSKLDAKEIKREKGVIVEEINMYLDTPMRYVGDLFEQLLYGDNSMGWDIAGNKEVVRSLERPDFIKYFNSHYLTENTIVCVSGNIDSESVIRKVSQYFKKARHGVQPKVSPAKMTNGGQSVLLHYKETDQTHLYLGVPAYDLFDPRRYALILLSAILGGYMSSRLWLSVREKNGLAYYVRAGAQFYTDSGYFAVKAGSDNTRVDKTIKTIVNELKKIKQKPVGKEELKKAKENIKGSLMIDLESSDALADFFGLQEILTKNILTLEEVFASIEKVTTKDIFSVARDILKTEKLRLAMIGPFKEDEKFKRLLSL